MLKKYINFSSFLLTSLLLPLIEFVKIGKKKNEMSYLLNTSQIFH